MRPLRYSFVATMGLAMALCAPSVFASPTKDQKAAIRSMLLDGQYHARVDLFRVRVAESGIVENPWDAESIKAGSFVQITAMQVRGNMVRVVLAHPAELGRTAVVFRFKDDLGEDPGRELATLEKMVGYVFRPAPGDGAGSTAPSRAAGVTVAPEELREEVLALMGQGFEEETLAGYVARQRLTVGLSADDMSNWQATGIPESVIRAALACTIADE